MFTKKGLLQAGFLKSLRIRIKKKNNFNKFAGWFLLKIRFNINFKVKQC